MAANSSVYFLRFPFADESEILSGFSFMNESSKKYVIILCINIVYKNCVKILLNKVKAQQKNKKIIKTMISIGNGLKLCYQCNLREKAAPLLHGHIARLP